MALTQLLYKIFVKGFYKAHAGQLLFLFGTILTYLFYIQVLSDDHITTQETIFYNLSFVLTIISSPILGVLMMVVFLIFTIKSYNYISAQLYLPPNFFLFYSANAFNKSQQLKSWFISQLLISLPIIFYIFFSVIVGWVYGYYLIPLLFLFFVIVISLICAILYTQQINTPIKAYNPSFLVRNSKKVTKKLLTITILQVFDKYQITFWITKLLALGLSIGLLEILSDINPYSLGALVALVAALSNAILIFEMYRFERQYLSFTLNFPTKLLTIFIRWILLFLVLTLPEIIALKFLFEWPVFLNSVFILVSICLGLKSSLLMVSLHIKAFLYTIFALLFLSVLFIQFGGSQLLGLVFCSIAAVLFYTKYYHQSS